MFRRAMWLLPPMHEDMCSVHAMSTVHAWTRCQSSPACAEPCGRLVELWDEELLKKLSMHDRVARIVALGSSISLLATFSVTCVYSKVSLSQRQK